MKKSRISYLAKKGLPVYIDAEHHTAHNKVMIVDGETVITGSFNFIDAAERENAENLPSPPLSLPVCIKQTGRSTKHILRSIKMVLLQISWSNRKASGVRAAKPVSVVLV